MQQQRQQERQQEAHRRPVAEAEVLATATVAEPKTEADTRAERRQARIGALVDTIRQADRMGDAADASVFREVAAMAQDDGMLDLAANLPEDARTAAWKVFGDRVRADALKVLGWEKLPKAEAVRISRALKVTSRYKAEAEAAAAGKATRSVRALYDEANKADKGDTDGGFKAPDIAKVGLAIVLGSYTLEQVAEAATRARTDVVKLAEKRRKAADAMTASADKVGKVADEILKQGK